MKRARLRAVAIVVSTALGVLTLVAPSSEGSTASTQWPMYGHDPAHTGRAAVNGPTQLEPAWSLPLGTLTNTNNSPVLGPDGSIYMATWTKFFAVDPDGDPRCDRSLFAGAAAPAVSNDGSVVYVPDSDGLHAFNATTCATVWDFDTRITYSSPTVGPDGTIYFGSAEGSSNSHLYALNPDKSIKWDWDSGSGCWIESSPALGPNGEVYFHHNCLGVVALDANGSYLWARAGLGEAWNTASVGPDGTVYVGDTDGSFYALNPADGTTKWQAPVSNWMYNASASISADGSRIYRGDNGGIFYAFRSTGTVAWQYDTGVDEGIFSAPALSANDVVYFTQAAANGLLYALRASDKTLLDTYQIGYSESSPALGADGTLYAVGDDAQGHGVLYAFPTPAVCSRVGDVLTIDVPSGASITIGRSGVNFEVAGGGNPDPGCGGSTVNNVNTVNVIGAAAGVNGADADETVTYDTTGGNFEPGLTPEGTGISEIEFNFDLGSGDDTLSFRLGALNDRWTAGITGINPNNDADADLTLAGVESVIVKGGDGSDVLSAAGKKGTGSAFPTSVVLQGGNGKDTLTGGLADDSIDGGTGNDTFKALNVADGADDFVGGPNTDTASYAARPAGAGGVTVDPDDNADDGKKPAGEGDNIHSDVENVKGSKGNDTIDDGGQVVKNSFKGGNGNDTIDTVDGVGNDTIDGGGGSGDSCTGDPGDAITNCP